MPIDSWLLLLDLARATAPRRRKALRLTDRIVKQEITGAPEACDGRLGASWNPWRSRRIAQATTRVAEATTATTAQGTVRSKAEQRQDISHDALSPSGEPVRASAEPETARMRITSGSMPGNRSARLSPTEILANTSPSKSDAGKRAERAANAEFDTHQTPRAGAWGVRSRGARAK